MTKDIRETNNLDQAATFLAAFLEMCDILPDGTVIETRRRVAQINGVSIHVYSDEHPPPHFHVKCSGKEASFTIETCKRIEGNLGRREEKILKYWFELNGQSMLIEAWNNTRPGDCTIGRYLG